MDRAVTRAGVSVVLARVAVAAAVALCAHAGMAAAQSMGDPTQPPVSVLVPSAPGASTVGTPESPQLQSVLVSSGVGGRRLAVINGEVVATGARIGDAVVAQITDSQVVLRRGNATQVLKVFPHDGVVAGGKTRVVPQTDARVRTQVLPRRKSSARAVPGTNAGNETRAGATSQPATQVRTQAGTVAPPPARPEVTSGNKNAL